MRRPVHLWIVGIVSLLWNSMGAFDYTATQLRLDFYMKQVTPEMLAYIESFPAWAVAGWAFGVWGAFAGSIGLLLAKRWSVTAFAMSLAGLAVSTVYQFFIAARPMGGGELAFTGTIWLVAIALLWYSSKQKAAGHLGGSPSPATASPVAS